MTINESLPEEVKVFLLEAYENVDSVEQQLVALEQDPRDNDLLNAVFRSIHTIKGNSGFYGFKNLEVICHRGETLLAALRAGEYTVDPDITSALLSLTDAVRELLTGIESSGAEPAEADYGAVAESLADLHKQRMER